MDNAMRQKLQEMARQQHETTEKLLSFVPSLSGEWRAGKEIFELAQTSDILSRRIESLLNVPKPDIPAPVGPLPTENAHENHEYYVSNERLCYRGIGRNEGFEHSIPKDRFQKVLMALEGFLESREFPMKMLKGRLDGMPAYQPNLVVRLLFRRLGLLVRPRRGWYRFANPVSFAENAARIWEEITTTPIER